MVVSGTITLCVDARILDEYEEVLARKRFGFDADAVSALIDYIESASLIVAPVPLAQRLPDFDDEPFLAAALAGAAEYLVTGNLAHFPQESRAGVSVLTPARFVEEYRARSQC